MVATKTVIISLLIYIRFAKPYDRMMFSIYQKTRQLGLQPMLV